jgi:GAF domain-containing protein
MESDHEPALVDQLSLCLTRSGQLHALTKALCGALSVAEVADEVSSHTRAALGTHFAGVALIDEERRALRYVSMAPLPPAVVAEWSEFPLSERVPGSDVARTGRPSYYAERAEVIADYPHIAADLAQAHTEGMVTVPLIARGESIGSLMLTWTSPHRCDDLEREFLATLAGQCALAICALTVDGGGPT